MKSCDNHGGLKTLPRNAMECEKIDAATALIWKVLQIAETTFRRLNAPELLPAVYAGARYVDGVKQAVDAAQQEVAA